MLVELTPDKNNIERMLEVCKEYKFPTNFVFNDKWVVEKGIYMSEHFSFPKEMFIETKTMSFDDEYRLFAPNYEKVQYGVADSIEQIKEYFKDEIESARPYIISVAAVYQDKENAGKGGGWRWHKWGEYIGKLNPQCEYLDDENFGEDFQGYVLVFHILPINITYKKFYSSFDEIKSAVDSGAKVCWKNDSYYVGMLNDLYVVYHLFNSSYSGGKIELHDINDFYSNVY